jgi:hypothetical protein
MSTTSLPDDAPSEPPPRPAVQPPVLASAILLEDVAPLRPAQRLLRAALASMAVVFACAGACGHLGITRNAGATGSLATAGVAFGFALARAPYAARAVMAIIVGLMPLTLGAAGEGPLAPHAGEPTWRAFAGLTLIALLPGVLLFRARYRALTAARILLGIAFALAAPAVVAATFGAFDASASIPIRIADASLAAAAFAGAFGFMGAETTGGGGVWAACIVAAAAGRVGCSAWTLAPGQNGANAAMATLGFAAASMPVALGCMQLLAVWLAAGARRKVDVHKTVGPSEEH